MITKATLLKCSIKKFTQCGSKHVTLDEIANTLGISKKTIYTFYKNKEALVSASIESLLNEYKVDINGIVNSNGKDPVLCVIIIYQRGFEYLKYFKPSFLFGLEKYYPKANALFEDFVEELSNTIVYKLLKQAQESGDIKAEVNLKLIVSIYFLRIDKLVFKKNNLFDLYPKEELFNHLVVYNLKGIITPNYSNSYFE
ncbi:TetR/AcrR family transcriptional regulator [Algibacter amylolyticus]|uniref:TetR/AcrR family transcriptional regulator n=1 Tax=Algibacter amylolyticus TaxID=1608400 RepID=A0A5M7BF19_9FLAO|nr:TetR/AcrR family transcriptional regulator [Algibacter amylolyticus]KAA5827593.1 TetR/AcrR family transcriptional regulator [Algibacter amylolyticus]MBB5266801.1 AcrR family transcriptional regulator [Algibacter amylolyticus]TSJ81838.1 TetR/AcrR family transcriptional regulator [Algibacter amylolyticus]